ncbi:MAG: hypothetical protein HY747_02175, partial [Elusimicrobia bacterium]|nr:hypothetical protein [Elusimicrobiota bacterium]
NAIGGPVSLEPEGRLPNQSLGEYLDYREQLQGYFDGRVQALEELKNRVISRARDLERAQTNADSAWQQATQIFTAENQALIRERDALAAELRRIGLDDDNIPGIRVPQSDFATQDGRPWTEEQIRAYQPRILQATQDNIAYLRQLRDEELAVKQAKESLVNVINEYNRLMEDLSIVLPNDRTIRSATVDWNAINSIADPAIRLGEIQRLEDDLQERIANAQRLAERVPGPPLEGSSGIVGLIERFTSDSPISPILAQRLEDADNWLESQGITPSLQRQRSSDAYLRFGSYPWQNLAEDPQRYLAQRNGNSQSVYEHDMWAYGNLDALKRLDLRFPMAYGPRDEGGRPLMGQAVVQDNPDTVDINESRQILEPLVVIPARIEVRSQPGNEEIGLFGWTRDNGTRFHAGVDFTATGFGRDDPDEPGNQRGMGLPVGLRRRTEIIEVRYQSRGHGAYVILQDSQNPEEFYVLSHAGVDDNPDLDGKSGILVYEGDTVEAFRPIIVMGNSGNANRSGPGGTPEPQVHVERYIIPQDRREEVAGIIDNIDQELGNMSVADNENERRRHEQRLKGYQDRLRSIINTHAGNEEGHHQNDGYRDYAADPLQE